MCRAISEGAATVCVPPGKTPEALLIALLIVLARELTSFPPAHCLHAAGPDDFHTHDDHLLAECAK